jgi:hypothetical protein
VGIKVKYEGKFNENNLIEYWSNPSKKSGRIYINDRE